MGEPTPTGIPPRIHSYDSNAPEGKNTPEKPTDIVRNTHEAAAKPLVLKQIPTAVRMIKQAVSPPSDEAKQVDQQRSVFFGSILRAFRKEAKSVDDKAARGEPKLPGKKYIITEWFKRITSKGKQDKKIQGDISRISKGIKRGEEKIQIDSTFHSRLIANARVEPQNEMIPKLSKLESSLGIKKQPETSPGALKDGRERHADDVNFPDHEIVILNQGLLKLIPKEGKTGLPTYTFQMVKQSEERRLFGIIDMADSAREEKLEQEPTVDYYLVKDHV